jgi:hypothetical protein
MCRARMNPGLSITFSTIVHDTLVVGSELR